MSENDNVVEVIEGDILLPDNYEPIDAEFEYAKTNLVNILEQSNNVLEESAKLAVESDDPRAYNAYSKLIKSLTDVNLSVLGLREKKMTMKDELPESKKKSISSGTGAVGTNTTIIYTCTTEEMIDKMRKKI